MNYAEKLSKMIQVETVSVKNVRNIELFDKFHTLLKELFPNVFRVCEVTNFDGSLMICLKSDKATKNPIMMMSHQDVVEESGEWTYPAFSGKIVDGKVWGRGTVDTKGALMCILQAFEEFIAEGKKTDRDLYIVSTCNEETMGEDAPLIASYLKDNNIKFDLVLDEGGMIKAEPLKGAMGRYAMMGAVEKGSCDLKFTARSAGGHASAPPKNSPLVRLGKFMAEVDKKDPFKGKLNKTTIELFKRLGPNTKGAMGFILRHSKGLSPILSNLLPKINPLGGAMIKTTVAFTTSKGSAGLNVLPLEAYVTGNIRIIHQDISLDNVVKKLQKIADKYQIEVSVIGGSDPWPIVDFNNPSFKRVEDFIKEVFPSVIPTPYVMTGGTDARHFAIVSDNVIRFAPLEINDQQFKSIHAIDENIDIACLDKGVEFYKKLLCDF